jgi:hypothetical protein
MNYEKKYIKYKQKYIQLKTELGFEQNNSFNDETSNGVSPTPKQTPTPTPTPTSVPTPTPEINLPLQPPSLFLFNLKRTPVKYDYEHNDSNLITTQTIDFNDITPFHGIEMYRDLIKYYIGIFTRINANSANDNFEKIIPFKCSFPKYNELELNISANKYKICNTNIKKINVLDQETIIFEHLFISNNRAISHYLSSSQYPIHVIKKNKTIFICFDVGFRDYEPLSSINFGNFLDTFDEILPELKLANQIVLCGHSNGMASATITAFLLLYLSDDDYMINNQISGEELKILDKDRDNYKFLKDKSIFVVGTGGFPVLFDTSEKFKLFYNKLNGRYLHILSGFKHKNKYFIDNHAREMGILENFKFGYYYTEYYNPTSKYIGEQCFYKIFINNGIKLQYPWTIVKTLISHKQGKLYYNYYKAPHIAEPILNIPIQIKNMPENEGYNFVDCKIDKDFISDIKYSCEDLVHNIHQFSIYRNILTIYFF